MDSDTLQQFWEWKINDMTWRFIRSLPPEMTFEQYEGKLCAYQEKLATLERPAKGSPELTDLYYWKSQRPPLMVVPDPSRMKLYYEANIKQKKKQ
jgi:hypothetical protein